MSATTAIVVFADSPLADARKKRLLAQESIATNTRLMTALKKRTISVARATGYPVVVVDHTLQVGKTFAERIQNAYHTVFQLGFEKIVLIGTDGSTDAETLKNSVLAFENASQSSAIAADCRGGAWLIALNRQAFETTGLNGIAWQTPRVYDDLLKCLEEVLQIETVLADFNSSYDLVKSFTDGHAQSLHRHISKLVVSFSFLAPQHRVNTLLEDLYILLNVGLRAPPTLV
jgi:uncharacterized protein